MIWRPWGLVTSFCVGMKFWSRHHTSKSEEGNHTHGERGSIGCCWYCYCLEVLETCHIGRMGTLCSSNQIEGVHFSFCYFFMVHRLLGNKAKYEKCQRSNNLSEFVPFNLLDFTCHAKQLKFSFLRRNCLQDYFFYFEKFRSVTVNH